MAVSFVEVDGIALRSAASCRLAPGRDPPLALGILPRFRRFAARGGSFNSVHLNFVWKTKTATVAGDRFFRGGGRN